MRVENPAALRFILQDNVYLLQSDKIATNSSANQPVAEIPQVPVPALPAPAPDEIPALNFSYLGNNNKQFLILTHYAADDFIAADHLTALQNILKRKEHDIADVAILNMAQHKVAGFNELLTYFKPQRLLILGAAAIPPDMEAPALNEPKKLQSCMSLYSYSFDEMMNSTDNKKAFWDQMKNL